MDESALGRCIELAESVHVNYIHRAVINKYSVTITNKVERKADGRRAASNHCIQAGTQASMHAGKHASMLSNVSSNN